MSLTIGPNANGYAGAWRQSDPTQRDPNTSRSGSGGGEAQQTGQPQVTDQIDITSITININQTTTTPSSDQLQVDVTKAAPPLATTGQVAQPLQGYFSSPNNFVPFGSSSADSSSTTEDSITLQIESETVTAATPSDAQSTHTKGHHPRGQAEATASSNGSSTPDKSTHPSIDISI
jgi:hypothetical protein